MSWTFLLSQHFTFSLSPVCEKKESVCLELRSSYEKAKNKSVVLLANISKDSKLDAMQKLDDARGGFSLIPVFCSHVKPLEMLRYWPLTSNGGRTWQTAPLTCASLRVTCTSHHISSRWLDSWPVNFSVILNETFPRPFFFSKKATAPPRAYFKRCYDMVRFCPSRFFFSKDLTSELTQFVSSVVVWLI